MRVNVLNFQMHITVFSCFGMELNCLPSHWRIKTILNYASIVLVFYSLKFYMAITKNILEMLGNIYLLK